MHSPPSRVYLERPTSGRERDYLQLANRPSRESFFVVAAATGQLAGVVDVMDMGGTETSKGRLAYFAFVPHAGSGLMTEGVSQVIDLAFDELGMARLDADIQPGNGRSRALAERLGFRRHVAPGVRLKIGSRWREHERWTLARDEWRALVRHERAERA